MGWTDGIGDYWEEAIVVIDTATGGGLSATVGLPPGTLGGIAATGAVGGAIGEHFIPRGEANSEDSADGSSAKQSAPIICNECCPRYQLDSELLLETNSGKVWKVDKQNNELIPIKKKLSKLDHLRAEIITKHSINEMMKKYEEEVLSKLPEAAKKSVQPW